MTLSPPRICDPNFRRMMQNRFAAPAQTPLSIETALKALDAALAARSAPSPSKEPLGRG